MVVLRNTVCLLAALRGSTALRTSPEEEERQALFPFSWGNKDEDDETEETAEDSEGEDSTSDDSPMTTENATAAEGNATAEASFCCKIGAEAPCESDIKCAKLAKVLPRLKDSRKVVDADPSECKANMCYDEGNALADVSPAIIEPLLIFSDMMDTLDSDEDPVASGKSKCCLLEALKVKAGPQSPADKIKGQRFFTFSYCTSDGKCDAYNKGEGANKQWGLDVTSDECEDSEPCLEVIKGEGFFGSPEDLPEADDMDASADSVDSDADEDEEE